MHICLYISKINNRNDTKDKVEELGLFYYIHATCEGTLTTYEVVQCYLKVWTWIGCKCIQQTLGQSLKKVLKITTNMIREERKWNYMKCSIKTTKERKIGEDKNRNKDQRQYRKH